MTIEKPVLEFKVESEAPDFLENTRLCLMECAIMAKNIVERIEIW